MTALLDSVLDAARPHVAGRVARITDYIKCAWVLDAASVAAASA